ncbi:MAG: hypothetical protein CR982_04945 [Candidatus Cloacimonadota bacterium]|nr:MAG: hypothetical protein CR982_04945 [Candidatus Cloacimonadota bacterium]PIE78503.1 MAG: hypothetical protein CSA15_07350 [Candidatus Delongbacteria bacterium]
MEILLLGGAPNVGKKEAMYRLTRRLIGNKFKVVAIDSSKKKKLEELSDFKVVAEKKYRGKMCRIIINSSSNTIQDIKNFKEFYDENGEYNILISSIIDVNTSIDNKFYPRKEFFKIMEITENENLLEIPFGKTRKASNRDWYQEKLDKLIDYILANKPYNVKWLSISTKPLLNNF